MLELDLHPFPTLNTERLILRELTNDDAEALYKMRSDERVMEHLARPRATTLKDAIALIERTNKERKENKGISWAMCFHDDKTLIGTVGYYRLQLENYRGEIGYMLSMDHWGKGLMTEAVLRAVDFGFNEMGFHSIEADTDPNNERSWKVLERCGFVREALFRENLYFEGKFYDSAVYSILSADQRK